MQNKIILNAAMLKALAGKTRIKILKLLNKRRYMQSELAVEVKLSVPTVKEHLNALEKAELVVKKEEGRKWKYYELTKKGRTILEPESSMQQVWIALGLLVFTLAGGLFNFLQNIIPMGVMKSEIVASEAMPPMSEGVYSAIDTAPAMEKVVKEAAPRIVEQTSPWLTLYIILVVILVIWLVYSIVRYKRLSKGKT